MQETEAAVEIAAAVEQVWKEAVDFTSHAEWMKDALSIRFEGERRREPGTVLLIETKVGPFRTVDRFEITAVEPMRLIAGRHTGLFTGEGRFELTPLTPERTLFVWRERIRFPWRFGGPAGAWIGKAILSRIWRTNLAEFKRRLEQKSRPGGA